jgi:ADP-ribose pyrophosphatase YjhB (NUDIX family)
MGASDYVLGLRQRIGHGLLLLPSVSVLVRDENRRVLLVRHADWGTWGLIGGSIDIDETPADAALREALEETGLVVELTEMVAALGGPGFTVTYPNGDAAAYVSIVYEAKVTGGHPRPDGEETTDVAWFGTGELASLDLGPFATATLSALGWLTTAPDGALGEVGPGAR